MAQANGELPTTDDLRGVLRRGKLEWAAYEVAVTRALAVWERATEAQRRELIAHVTDAHVELTNYAVNVHVSLGLPYDHILEGVFEDMP